MSNKPRAFRRPTVFACLFNCQSCPLRNLLKETRTSSIVVVDGGESNGVVSVTIVQVTDPAGPVMVTTSTYWAGSLEEIGTRTGYFEVIDETLRDLLGQYAMV